MRVSQVTVKNFQSYRELDFDYSDLGLALISGDTGAGKSAFMDAVAWTLFGVTSKDGAADDVRAWDASGPTEGAAEVHTVLGYLRVTRVRGPGKNDLYWEEEAGTQPLRGKDMTDTQRLLEKRLGVTAELFLTGSYLTQFSKADSFFIAKAKDRRDVLEQIADQEFAINLSEKTSEARKVAKKDAEALRLQEARESGSLGALEARVVETGRLIDHWKGSQEARIVALAVKQERWASDRAVRINALEGQAENFGRTKTEKLFDLSRKLEMFDSTKAANIAAIKAKASQWEAANDAHITGAQRELDGLEVNCPDKDYADLLADLEAEVAVLKRNKCVTCGGPHAGEAMETVRTQISQVTAARRVNDQLLDRRHRLEMTLKTAKAALNPHLSGLAPMEQQANPYGPQIEALKGQVNPYGPQIEAERASPNPFEEQLSSAMNDVNPYIAQHSQAVVAWEAAALAADGLQIQLQEKDALVSQLTWLYDKSFELRGLLMSRVVSQIESSTNAYLERFFDAALRVQFILRDSDKLEVEISNNGYPASFKSLSGGERCMLKLCFSLSLMKASQAKAGVEFGMVLLDEPFNGLSDGLKVKAFGLLQQLSEEYPTVLVIDHSPELKAQFSKVYLVDKASGNSQVHESKS